MFHHVCVLGVNVVTNGCVVFHHVCVLGVNVVTNGCVEFSSCLRVWGKCCYQWLRGVSIMFACGGKCCYQWLILTSYCVYVIIFVKGAKIYENCYISGKF